MALNKEKGFDRKEKIASKVQTLVAEILRDDFADDPIVAGVSLVGAKSRGGLNCVKLFYHVRGENEKIAQKRLDDINRMVRFKLAGKMNQKYVPELRFAYDDTLEKARRIDELLDAVAKE
jgi:ribosome-binding factor A